MCFLIFYYFLLFFILYYLEKIDRDHDLYANESEKVGF